MQRILPLGVLLAMLSTPVLAQDMLQELGNLLFTGDAANPRALPLGMVKVFDPPQCVIGIEEPQGGAFWIFLNNIDPRTVEFRTAIIGLERATMLVMDGSPYAAENRLEGPHATQFNLYTGLGEGLIQKLTLPVLQVAPDTLKGAFERVFAGPCAGKR